MTTYNCPEWYKGGWVTKKYLFWYEAEWGYLEWSNTTYFFPVNF